MRVICLLTAIRLHWPQIRLHPHFVKLNCLECCSESMIDGASFTRQIVLSDANTSNVWLSLTLCSVDWWHCFVVDNYRKNSIIRFLVGWCAARFSLSVYAATTFSFRMRIVCERIRAMGSFLSMWQIELTQFCTRIWSVRHGPTTDQWTSEAIIQTKIQFFYLLRFLILILIFIILITNSVGGECLCESTSARRFIVSCRGNRIPSELLRKSWAIVRYSSFSYEPYRLFFGSFGARFSQWKIVRQVAIVNRATNC